MKVLDLRCSMQHGFEGWFGSEDDFQRQLSLSLIACPLCGSHDVHKLLSAPRLNLGGDQINPVVAPSTSMDAPLSASQRQATWWRLLRQMVSQTEDVGERFVEEARRMHYGEVEARGIRGQASVAETAALLDEGIPILPLPGSLGEPLQ